MSDDSNPLEDADLWQVELTVRDPSGDTMAQITGEYLGPSKPGQLYLMVVNLMGGPEKVQEVMASATDELAAMPGGVSDPHSIN